MSKDITLYVEKVFETPEQRRLGLMYDYDPLRPFTCALFIFDSSQQISIWMKDTPRPLDIIFVREDNSVAHIHTGAIPFDTTRISSKEPVKYVVEALTGFVRTFHIEKNDHIIFRHANLVEL